MDQNPPDANPSYLGTKSFSIASLRKEVATGTGQQSIAATALIVGASGIVGSALATLPVEQG